MIPKPRKLTIHKIDPKFVWRMMCGKTGANNGTTKWSEVNCRSCKKWEGWNK